jgi:hypothetical protein
VEDLKDAALKLWLGVRKRLGEVGEAVEDGADTINVYGGAVALLNLDEPLIRDKRLMVPLGLDPFVFGAPNQWALARLDLAKVETVPVEPSRVDGVFKNGPYGRLCSLPCCVLTSPLCYGVSPHAEAASRRRGG